jgi:hypothetical protein
MNIKLVKTCASCPEQYDVFFDGERVGYLRLRHGWFQADYLPAPGHETVYQAAPEGDGSFKDHERKEHLDKAVAFLYLRHMADRPVPPEYTIEEGY